MADVMDRPAEEGATEGALETVEQKTVKVKPRTKPLTEREEKQLFTLFATAEHAERLILLEAFEGKAHAAVGMDSFEQYCRERLGLPHDASYLSRLVKAAKFERQVTGKSFNSLKLAEVAEEKEMKKLPPLRTVLEITRVPDEKKWVSVYDEYNAFRLSNEDNPVSLEQQKAELKKIVSREIKAADPDAPRAGRRPGSGRAPIHAEPANKNGKEKTPIASGLAVDHGTVKGQRYEGSEEQAAVEKGEVTYKEAVERMREAEEIVGKFVALMESGELDVKALNELYNDATAYQKQYGL